MFVSQLLNSKPSLSPFSTYSMINQSGLFLQSNNTKTTKTQATTSDSCSSVGLHPIWLRPGQGALEVFPYPLLPQCCGPAR